MDTNRLRQFCAIAELGSVTKASELLHITHSGLSKSMKLLQQQFGFALLRPAGRGLALTQEGLVFYQRAKELLETETRLFKFEKNHSQLTLKIGTVEIFLTQIAEQLKHPIFKNTAITLLDLEPGNMEHLIATQQLDFGLTYAPFPTENVEIIEIGKFSLACYHLKGAFKNMEISEIPFVTPATGLSSNPLQIKERDGWHESVYPRNKKYNVNLLSTAIELTLQGLCAIYMPDFIARKINAARKPNQCLVKHPFANQNNLQRAFLLKHKDRAEDSISQHLASAAL